MFFILLAKRSLRDVFALEGFVLLFGFSGVSVSEPFVLFGFACSSALCSAVSLALTGSTFGARAFLGLGVRLGLSSAFGGCASSGSAFDAAFGGSSLALLVVVSSSTPRNSPRIMATQLATPASV